MEKSFDINTLSEKQVDELSIKIGSKVRSLVDKFAEKMNVELQPYGVAAKFQIMLVPAETGQVKKRRGRPRKQSLI